MHARMHESNQEAVNFRLWMRDKDGIRASDRALFHTTGQTTYWYSSTGSTVIPSGRYKLSGQMMGELQGPFDPIRSAGRETSRGDGST